MYVEAKWMVILLNVLEPQTEDWHTLSFFGVSVDYVKAREAGCLILSTSHAAAMK